MIRPSKSYSWACRSLWRLALLAVLFAVALSGAAIANEQSDLNGELESLRALLLRQIEYAKKLNELSTEQRLKLSDYEKHIAELERISMDSKERIRSLRTQLEASDASVENLQQVLVDLRILHGELRVQHEKLSKSFTAFKKESQKQIEDLQVERSRYRRRTLFALIGGGFLGWLIDCIIEQIKERLSE